MPRRKTINSPNCVTIYHAANDELQTVCERLKAGKILFDVLPLSGSIRNPGEGYRLDIFPEGSKVPIIEMLNTNKGVPSSVVSLDAGRYNLTLSYIPQNEFSLRWLSAGSIEVG